MSATLDERILVLMPTAKDGVRTAQMLTAVGLPFVICDDFPQLCHEIKAGAIAALLTEEVIEADRENCLPTVLQQQPQWSDLPLIVLAREHESRGHLREAMNVTLVERPVKARTLLSVIRAAMRSRRHQYAVRDDLEQRRASELERYRLAETLQLALAAAELGAWEWEPSTDRTTFSPQAAAIYGVEPDRVYLRESLRQLIHPDHRDRARAVAARAVADRIDYHIEYPLAADENPRRWVAAHGRGVYDQAGRLVRMLGIVHDITAAKLAEQSLRASDDRHRFLAQLAAATQPLTDPNEVLAVSARLLAEHLRADRCAYAEVEEELYFLITGDYAVEVPSIVGRWPVRAFGAVCQRMMLDNEPYVVEDTDTDSRIGPEDLPAYRATNIRAVICIPLHKHGRFTAAMAVHQTQPRQWQPEEIRLVTTVVAQCWEALERARAVQELRDADRKKDDFIALLAHELRNPLAPVRNGLQVLNLASHDEELGGRTREMMERQLGHMVRLIDDLLDVSRISRNKMQLRRERVLLADIISAAVETAQPAIDAKSHHLQISLPQRPIALDADLTRLAQVFSNLLTNSAKYTPSGGRITIVAEPQDTTVAVSIQDTGIGIPGDALDHIFDMFSQVDRSIDGSTGGLGIGLALVKGLVEMHSGMVSATSDGPGHGSMFVVELPMLAPAQEPHVTAPLAAASQGDRRKILVVDDNRDGAESLKMMLKLLGNDVRMAHDGVEAIELAEEFSPQVILMDVGMPRMNGYEATRRIREQAWGREMIIIALTGWGQDHDRTLSHEAGCNSHLVKPVELATLEKELNSLTAVEPSGVRT